MNHQCIIRHGGDGSLECFVVYEYDRVARIQHLSGRGVTRLLRVARTVADLEGCDAVGAEHIAEVVGFRAKGER